MTSVNIKRCVLDWITGTENFNIDYFKASIFRLEKLSKRHWTFEG